MTGMFRFLLVLIVSLTIDNAWARVISVSNVKVDVQDKNAVAAKDKAMVQAKREAYRMLVSEQPALGLNPDEGLPSDRQLNSLVEDIEVVRERMSGATYGAVYNVNFNENNILEYAADPNFKGAVQKASLDVTSTVRPFGSPESSSNYTGPSKPSPQMEEDFDVKPAKKTSLTLKKYVIVPIYVGSDDAQLWEENNPWLNYWVARDTKTGGKEAGITYRVPLADLRDRTTCTIEQVNTEKSQPISLLIERYHAEGAVVPILKNLDDGQNGHELQIKVFSRAGRLSVGEPIFIEGKNRPLSDIFAKAAAQAFNPEDEIIDEHGVETDQTVSRPFAPSQGGGSSAGKTDNLLMKVSFRNLGEWTDIKRRMTQSSFIGRFDVKKLSKQQAEVMISSNLSQGDLYQKLSAGGLFVQEGAGLPTISLTPGRSQPFMGHPQGPLEP